MPELVASLRTDDSFLHQDDSIHHTSVSPFTQLGYKMVSGFPLDYMHLICLGVVRRLISLWIDGPSSCKLSQSMIKAVSEKLIIMRQYVSREFSRKPRSLSEFKQWKATELRLFLVYIGPVVLKGFLSPQCYNNFLDLSVAVRILLCSSLLENFADYAGQLLRYFIQTFGELYGKDQLVYNIHSLLHIVDDAKKYGPLDNCSSFKYESYLGQLKKLVRKPQSPCAQIAKRIFENHDVIKPAHRKHSSGKFSKMHIEGPVTVSLRHCLQYKQYQKKQTMLCQLFTEIIALKLEARLALLEIS